MKLRGGFEIIKRQLIDFDRAEGAAKAHTMVVVRIRK